MKKTNSKAGSSRAGNAAGKSQPESMEPRRAEAMESSQLMKLFEDQLKDIYWAEKALTKAIPKMIKKATSPQLIEGLEKHLRETQEQVMRCEQVFRIIEKRAVSKKCEAMEGLLKEGDEIIEECEEGPMRDAGIISAAQKVEHYEIASYGTLRTFAQTLGLAEAAAIFEQTLNEEKAADEKLSEVAMSAVNVQAAGKEEGEDS